MAKIHSIIAQIEQEIVAIGIIIFFILLLLLYILVAVRYSLLLLVYTLLAALFYLTQKQAFFSSGILIIGNKGADSSEHSSIIGDWGIRLSALKLFLVLSLPLIGISLGI